MRWSASRAFECFSQRICLTLTAVEAFNPLPCQDLSRSAYNKTEEFTGSMSIPFQAFPPCLSSLRHSLCLSLHPSCPRHFSCLWRLRPSPLVQKESLGTVIVEWAVGTGQAPIGLTGFTVIRSHVGCGLVWKSRVRWTQNLTSTSGDSVTLFHHDRQNYAYSYRRWQSLQAKALRTGV